VQSITERSGDLYLNSILVHPPYFVDDDCAYDLMLRNIVNGAFTLPPGLSISTPDFDQVAYAPFFDVLGALVVSLGWKRGVNFFNAWYDTSVSPPGQVALGYYTRLQALISNSTGTLLVCVSAGCIHGYYFLTSTGLDPLWKQKHIHQWVLLGSVLAGITGIPTIQYALMQNAEQNVYSLLEGWQSWSGMVVAMNEQGSWLYPDIYAYGGDIIWQVSSPWFNLNLNASAGSFLRSIVGQIYTRFVDERGSTFGQTPPGVSSVSFCGTNVNTPQTELYNLNGPVVNTSSTYFMQGDGMIGVKYCTYHPSVWWQQYDEELGVTTRIETMNGVDHLGLIEDVAVLLSWLPDLSMNITNTIQLQG